MALAGGALAVAATVGVVVASRGGSTSPDRPFQPPAASKRFGDDADLMRRLERKKLTTRDR